MQTMTKETIRASLHSPECLSFVKSRLNSLQQLPEEGFVAGQAVSSAVVEFLKLDHIINPVYNDIDVFKYVNGRKMSAEQARRFVRKANATVLNSHLSYDRGSDGVFVDTFHYDNKVVDSVRVGDFINETTTIRIGCYSYGGKKDLQQFDINSTQVGFLLKKKGHVFGGLVFTEDFLSFLVTRELQIVRFKTPIHSIVRLHKKQAELGGVSADFETNELLAYTQAAFAVAYKNQKTVAEDQEHIYYHPIFFGEKYKNHFSQHGLDKKGHTLFSEEIFRRTGKGEDASAVSAVLNSLIIPPVVDNFYNYASGLQGYGMDKDHARFMGIFSKEVDINSLSLGEMYSLSRIPGDTHRMKKVSKSASSLLSDIPTTQRHILQSLHRKEDLLDLALNVDADLLEESLPLAEFFAEHEIKILRSVLHYGFISVDERLQMLKNIRTMVKESSSFVEALRSMRSSFSACPDLDISRFIDIEVARNFDVNHQVSLSALLKKRMESFAVGDYAVKELVSSMELLEEGDWQNQFIASRSRSVKSGETVIISVACHNPELSIEERKSRSLVLELGKNTNSSHNVETKDAITIHATYPRNAPSGVDLKVHLLTLEENWKYFSPVKLPGIGRFYQKHKKPYVYRDLQAFSNKESIFRPDLVEVFKKINEVYPSVRMPLAESFSNCGLAMDYLPADGNKSELTLAYRVMFRLNNGLSAFSKKEREGAHPYERSYSGPMGKVSESFISY